MNAYWIWYPGDFELYHSLKLHLRRTEFTFHRPAFWRLDDCWHNVIFRLQTTLEKTETFTVKTNGIGNITISGDTIGTIYFPHNTPVTLEPGSYVIKVLCAKMDGLPCVYVEGDTISSDARWEADNNTGKWLPVGYSEMYTSPKDDPEVFRFAYEDIRPIASEKVENGMLYDFGRETFARLVFEDTAAGEEVRFYYGESREEALDISDSYLTDVLPAEAGAHRYPARAFRYVYIPETHREFALKAEYEYLPLEYKGSFRSSDEKLDRIWATSAYTFHLNSREFFLDGIKRDRWVWSGDAYQSYLTNYYLFFDRDLVKRTTIALRGKDPVVQHLNTILDYSFYWIIALADYYRYTGDLQFLQMIWPKAKGLLEFCISRCDAEGFAAGLPDDWVFIDWHNPLDKTGALCAEQMLYLKALETGAKCAALLGEDGSRYHALADSLRGKIDRFFWNEEKGAYIDSYESGKNNVTRHANIFALLFDIADDRNVVKEPEPEENARLHNSFPYMREQQEELRRAVKEQNKPLAREVLNQLLRYVYSPHPDQVALIRSRAVQLVWMLTGIEPAGEGERQENQLYRQVYIPALKNAATLEDVDITLAEMLHLYVDYSFDFSEIRHSDTIYRVMEYIKSNYSRKVTLEDISSYVHLSPSHLSGLFRKETGQTISAYLSFVRIEKSKHLLSTTDTPIAQIGALCGFEDQSYFTRVFRQQTGLSPKKYRQSESE